MPYGIFSSMNKAIGNIFDPNTLLPINNSGGGQIGKGMVGRLVPAQNTAKPLSLTGGYTANGTPIADHRTNGSQGSKMYAGGGGTFNESTGKNDRSLQPGEAGYSPTGNYPSQEQPASTQSVNQNTGGGLYEDPGYLFRMQQGQQKLDRSMIGRQLGGRAVKEALRYGQGFGSQEFGNAYNRALNRYNTKYNARYNRLADLSNRWGSRAGVGQSAVNTGVNMGQTFASNYGNTLQTGATNQGNLATQRSQDYQNYLANMGNIVNQAGTAYGNYLGSQGGGQ